MGEIKTKSKRNVVQARAFSETCWSRRFRKYQNRAIETAQVIEELIRLAEDIRNAQRSWRGA